MTRWSLFLQTLSLLHHFLRLYCSALRARLYTPTYNNTGESAPSLPEIHQVYEFPLAGVLPMDHTHHVLWHRVIGERSQGSYRPRSVGGLWFPGAASEDHQAEYTRRGCGAGCATLTTEIVCRASSHVDNQLRWGSMYSKICRSLAYPGIGRVPGAGDDAARPLDIATTAN